MKTPPLLTKTQIAELVRSGRAHECFTHSEAGTFDVSLMLKVAPFLYDRFSSDLNEELISKIKASRDWDQDRINSFTIAEVMFPTLWVLDSSDGTHILIDGTHRMIALFERFKQKTFKGWMATNANAIRPSKQILINHVHDWGRMKVVNGKLYNRETGQELK